MENYMKTIAKYEKERSDRLDAYQTANPGASALELVLAESEIKKANPGGMHLELAELAKQEKAHVAVLINYIEAVNEMVNHGGTSQMIAEVLREIVEYSVKKDADKRASLDIAERLAYERVGKSPEYNRLIEMIANAKKELGGEEDANTAAPQTSP